MHLFGNQRKYAQYELQLGEASKALAAAHRRNEQLADELAEERHIVGQLRLRLVQCEQCGVESAIPAPGEPTFQAMKRHVVVVATGQFA